MNWQSKIDIYVYPTMCKIAGGKLLCGTGSSGVLSNDLEGSVGVCGRDLKREGTYRYICLIHVVQQKPKDWKAIILL